MRFFGPTALASIRSILRFALVLALYAAAAPPVRAEIDALPGMPPVVNPQNLYSETGADHVSPEVAHDLPRVYVPSLGAGPGLCHRSGAARGHRQLPGRQGAAPHRPVLGSQDAVGHEHRIAGCRGKPDADRSEDRQARARRFRSPIRTICISRRTANRRLSSRSGCGASISATRIRWRRSIRSPTPQCAGVNHADFSIDGKYAIFTCEFNGGLIKVDIAEPQGRRPDLSCRAAGCRRICASRRTARCSTSPT